MTRTRRTKAEVDRLRAQILVTLRHDHPQSVRHIFYRMTDPRLECPAEKSERMLIKSFAEQLREGRL